MKQAALTDEGMRRELRAIEATLSIVNSESEEGKVLKSRLRSLKNRLAAKRSRECRKDYVRELEERLAGLEQENSSLRAQLGLPPSDTPACFGSSGSSDDFSCGDSVASTRSTQHVITSSSESQELHHASFPLCPLPIKGHADVLTGETCGEAVSDVALVAEPLELRSDVACSCGAYSVAPFGAVCLPASPISFPAKCAFPLAPIPYSADPGSLGFYDVDIFHEAAQDEACADANCNVALWLNDSMC